MRNVSVRAVSTVVAPHRVSIPEELVYFGNSEENALRFSAGSGLHTRCIADDDVTASDMCTQAAQILLAQIDVDPHDIDALVCQP